MFYCSEMIDLVKVIQRIWVNRSHVILCAYIYLLIIGVAAKFEFRATVARLREIQIIHYRKYNNTIKNGLFLNLLFQFLLFLKFLAMPGPEIYDALNKATL